MDLVVGGLSSLISIVSFTLFAMGIVKLFQMTTLLSEIKEILGSIQHNALIQPPAAAPTVPSSEEMLRALRLEMDHPVSSATSELEPKS